MNMPKTLLEIAGVGSRIARWNQAALILVDAQMEYVTGAVPLNGMDTAVRDCAALLALARKYAVPVVHVVHHGRPGGALFDPAGPQVEEIRELAAEAGEKVIVKRLPNSFVGTDLDEFIRSTGRKELIIAGFATHMCISATVRSALDHQYASTVVASACATRDLPNPLGRTIPAATVHMAALAELADRFAAIVPSPEALDAEEGSQPAITLRPVTDDDIALIADWPAYPSESADLDYALRGQGWLKEFRGKPETRCLVIQQGADPIGFVILAKTAEDAAEFRIALRADQLGKRLGETAMRATLDMGYSEMGLARIHLVVRKNNRRAMRLYQRLGFVATGERSMNVQGRLVAFLEMARGR